MGCAPASGPARALILHAVRTPSQSARRKHGRDRNSTHRDEASPLVSSANWERLQATRASKARRSRKVTMQQALGAAAHSPLLASTMGSDPSGEIRSPAMARRHGNVAAATRAGLLCLHHRAECDQRHPQGNGGNAVRQCRHTFGQVAHPSPSPYGEVGVIFMSESRSFRTLGPRAGESGQTLVSLLVSD